MTAVRPLFVAAALAALGACATAPTPEPMVQSESPAPTPIAGYDWHFNGGEDEASLAYGVAESDDVRLSLHCARGSGDLALHKDVPEDAPREIHLESGGETERFPASGEPSMLTDGVILTASANLDNPVFQRFRRVGWLASWVGDRREPYAAHPGSEAAIERFFAACG